MVVRGWGIEEVIKTTLETKSVRWRDLGGREIFVAESAK